jgi:hypothetical protein
MQCISNNHKSKAYKQYNKKVISSITDGTKKSDKTVLCVYFIDGTQVALRRNTRIFTGGSTKKIIFLGFGRVNKYFVLFSNFFVIRVGL